MRKQRKFLILRFPEELNFDGANTICAKRTNRIVILYDVCQHYLDTVGLAAKTFLRRVISVVFTLVPVDTFCNEITPAQHATQSEGVSNQSFVCGST